MMTPACIQSIFIEFSLDAVSDRVQTKLRAMFD